MEKQTEKKKLPVRIIPIGGVEEIGRNMTVVEYGDEIIVIDAGIQFPEAETPGIDFIIPNTEYLEKNKSKIKALVISHGHMDHVGAIPYLIDKLGFPVIYTTRFSKAIIQKRQDEFRHTPTLKIEEVTSDSVINLGKLKIKFFDITHAIPDAIGVIIETPYGNVIYPGDFRIELDENSNPVNTEHYQKLGKENNLVLFLESTNAEEPGFSIPEKVVYQNLEKIVVEAKNRIIIGMFSSHIERVIEIVKVAERCDKKVVIDGYSLKASFEIVKALGYFNPKKDVIVPIEKIDNYHPSKMIAICTGSQGEQNASLMRIASKKHKHLKITKDDTVILSSSVIPGNEKSIQSLKDNLSRQGARIIHYGVSSVHASGHACQEDLKLMVKMIKPKYLIPIHGNHFMLKTNADVAESVGMVKENIVVPFNNGVIIEADDEKIKMLKESVPANYVMVDGLGVGDVKEVV
ncbi:MAG: ribonuclease J, partial [Patescibacteria group bacterium]